MCVNLALYSQYARVCGCLCVFVCVHALRIVSTDKVLRFTNTLSIIIIKHPPLNTSGTVKL